LDKTLNTNVSYLVMDVDGTLTDGKIYIGENGEMMKAFDVKDGYAIKEMLPQYAITPVIISGRTSKITGIRAKELGVHLVFLGYSDKLSMLELIASETSTAFEEIAYIGDDISDLECIKRCGVSACPADAAEEVKSCVDYVTEKLGGDGAVREFVEHLIGLNKKLKNQR